MKDLQREILSQVAAGTITAEEGAARLEALESTPAEREPASAPAPPAAATSPVRQVKVVSRFGNTEIVGDPTVTSALADGPHRARQDGDTFVIEQSPVTEDTSFEFSRPHSRVVINGFDFGRKLVVRMNPDLALGATVQAGNVRIDGVHGRISADVQAGNFKLNDFRGPISVAVTAGNFEGRGLIDSGESSVRCEMGQVKVTLDRRSSVRINARTTMGKVAIDAEGARKDAGRVVVGEGAASLDLECTMGNVKVAVD